MRYIILIFFILLSSPLKADEFDNPIETFFKMHGMASECDLYEALPVKVKTYVDKLLPIGFDMSDDNQTGILNSELKKIQGYTFSDLFMGNQTYPKTIWEIYSDAQREIFDIYDDKISLKLTCEMIVGTYFMGMMHLHEILNDSLEVNAEK